MLNKVWAIARTQLTITFTDRGALALMLLMPVAISLIIGLAFGTDTADIEIGTASILIINQDEGAITGTGDAAREVNYGLSPFEEFLAEDIPEGLQPILEGFVSADNDIETARGAIGEGDFDAMLIIPPTFSADVVNPDAVGTVELYYNPGDSIQVQVILSVVEQFVNNLNTGRVAESIFVGSNNDGYLVEQAIASGNINEIEAAITEALPQFYSGDALDLVSLNAVDVEGEVQEFDSLQYFAPAMAILFMTFAMANGARGILEERKNWTQQRIVTTPTPRWVYMAGKMLGTYLTGVAQMVMLLVIMQVMASLLGRTAQVWGDNYLGILLVTLSVVGAATGLGLIIAALAKDAIQADSIANAVIIVMAVAGGSFIPVDSVAILDTLSQLTLNHWGLQGYTDLATNSASVSDILPNVMILLAMTAVFFGVSLFQFNRRLSV